MIFALAFVVALLTYCIVWIAGPHVHPRVSLAIMAAGFLAAGVLIGVGSTKGKAAESREKT